MSKLLIITGVSASGKTQTKEELVARGWKSAINFTTREPRSDKEKDDYVFIDKKTFKRKEENGDFLETTETYGELYGVSRCLPSGNVVTILDPIGRSQVMEKYARAGIEVETVYLDITPEEQVRRLEDRRSSFSEVKERQKDFNWFDRTRFCLEIDGTLPTEEIVNLIEYKCDL